MAKITFRDRIIAGLKAAGWTPDAVNLSTKFAGYYHPDYKSRFFVGKMGGLRYGRTATSSMAAGDPQHMTQCYLKYLALGDKVLAGQDPGPIGIKYP